MLMKRLACLLLVLAMTCLAAGCRWQKQAERQDWKEIEEKGVLRIGFYENIPRAIPDGLGASLAFGPPNP